MSNREQIDYWNGAAAERWVRRQADTDRALAAFGEAALDLLDPAPGEAVLDVGCGAGETLVQIATRVGASGRVVGVDPSRPLLERARERAHALGCVELVEADAATHAFDVRFDGVFSRFGVMFFADPAQAFANLRCASTTAGRLSFVCWQALELNPWVYVPLMAARTVLKNAALEADPEAPGPFSLSSADRVRGILTRAGYHQIVIEAFQAPVRLADSGIEATVSFAAGIGPVARLLVEQPEPVRLAVRDQIHADLLPFVRDGGVELDGAAWLVTARASSD